MLPIRLSKIKTRTSAEGPGLRYAIWVQGCPIRCKGCFNPHTWDFGGGYLSDMETVYEDIKRTADSTPDLSGVTFLGGEPFEQAEALSALAEKVQADGLGVVTFTGYEYDRILKSANSDAWRKLLRHTDLLIDGPYIERLHDLSRPWVGSKNQRYRFLTDVYREYETKLEEVPNKLEICLHPDGTVSANGMAGPLDLRMLESLMEFDGKAGENR
ncbi:4Fe-4S single cluster domain-containing protein [Saccharibacillus deserti]|uniref:4Fe-4S single cluster domain-containing protein n=1 Tax=Saccharibacillus deserti TaxID=1634444 RepID=UPI001553D792|nr:4Fe-4S single cluster domain-containing protein [Saccharibacillus deserti]